MAQQQKNLPESTSSLARWSPVREMTRLQRGIDRLFDEMLAPFGAEGWLGRELLGPSSMMQAYLPPCDIEETDHEYRVSFDLPGVSKEDLKVELRENQLIVTGERKQEQVAEKGVRHAVERFYGSFSRSFSLPGVVQAENIQASFENGVLRIVIPKSEAAQRRMIPITAGGEAASKKKERAA